MAYPLDNRCRPPYELTSCASSLVAASVVLGGTPWVGFLPVATTGFALGLLCNAVWRGYQGYKVLDYHANLRYLPAYEMRSEEIPCSKKELFLGMGFWWTPAHTQRLQMTRWPEYRHLAARNRRYERARRFCREHPNHWLTRKLDLPSRWNPFAPLPPVGGNPAIHGIEPDEQPIWTALSERVGHTLVLGTTRVGKTRLAELLITQDIRRGEVVIVFDPKGDVTLLKRMYAEACRAGRREQFYFFHLGYPELSDRYSPLSSIGRITEVATRIANPLPGEGNSAAFKQFVWLYVNIIARAASALGMNPTYTLIYQYAANLDALAERYLEYWLNRDHPGWESEMEPMAEKLLQNRIQQTGRTQRIIEIMDMLGRTKWSEPIADGLVSILANSKSKYQALINSLFPLLEKLTTGKVSELLSPTWDNPTEARRAFDWDKVMNTGGIVYFGLDALSDAEVAAAVGNAAFSDLTSTAGRRYKYGAAYGQSRGTELEGATRVCIHADEFNELCGDEFVPMLNKAGGAGYQVTAYTQTWNDVEAKIGSAAKAAQIGGNLNTLIMLRVKNTETAEILTDQLPKVQVLTKLMNSGASDAHDPDTFDDFTAQTSDRLTSREVPMLEPADLVQLPKGQCFALLEGGQLAKIRLPLAIGDDSDIHWPSSLEAVFQGMQSQYQTYVDHLPGDFEGGEYNELTVEGAGGGF